MGALLLVEDNDDIREMLSETLVHFVDTLVESSCAQDAKELLRQGQFTHLLTDLEMPEMDGIQLIEWCKIHRPHLRVALMSGNIEKLDRCQIADLYLKKPISEDFPNVITRFLSEGEK